MNCRLLAIELRRNSMIAVLPILAGLTYFSPARQHLTALAIWATRSADMQTALQGSGPVLAGVAAWMGGREWRSKLEDLLRSTSRPRLTRVLTTWTATTMWGLLFCTAVVALIVVITESQEAWGNLVLWPIVVSVLTIPALAAVGFALGHHFPNRFTPPLVAIGVFICFFAGMSLVQLGHRIGYLVPVYPSITPSDSVWYEDRPDLGLVQAMFLLGLTSGSLASLGVAQPGRKSFRSNLWVGLSGGVGVALTIASVFLIGSSRSVDGMLWVPAFGGPAADVAIRYTPMCRVAPLRVCVHPAYRSELHEMATLVNRIAAPLVGLPGAPALATQRPSTWGVVTDGHQHVLAFAAIDLHDPAPPAAFRESWEDQLAVSLVSDSHMSTTGLLMTGQAQNAVALYLLRRAGLNVDPAEVSLSASVTAAERRFAGLSPWKQRQWLRTHYNALRLGRVVLGELP